VLSRIPLLLSALLVLTPANAATDSVAPAAPMTAGPCGLDQQPTGIDLARQIQGDSIDLEQVAVSSVSNFQGLWKVITDTFGPPPKDVLADPSVITSLQVVWFIDPADPKQSIDADIYAFDAHSCYVADIGIEPAMFSLITPYTTMPTLAALLSGGASAAAPSASAAGSAPPAPVATPPTKP
jgi:hypothetical protein